MNGRLVDSARPFCRGLLAAIVVSLSLVGGVQAEEDPTDEIPSDQQSAPTSADPHVNDTGYHNCGELTATEDGWSDAELQEILECRLGIDFDNGVGSQSLSGSAASNGSTGCEDMRVRVVMQDLVYVRYLSFLVHPVWTFWTYFTCMDGGSPHGIDTGFQQIRGSANLGRYCSVRSGSNLVIQEVGSGTQCRAYQTSSSGRSALVIHGIRLRAMSDTRYRQAVIWGDLDSDSIHDPGEPYDITFSRQEGESGGFLVTDLDSDVPAVSRDNAVRRLKLIDHAGRPVVAAIGFEHIIGPSVGSRVSCSLTTQYGLKLASDGKCRTSRNGVVNFSYHVGSISSALLRQDADVFRIYLDGNANGRFDSGERYRFMFVRIAKPIHYVALGDSYSAGEHGHPSAQEAGSEYFDVKDADLECRRWKQAYSEQVSDFLLGAVSVTSYACTGAVTYNIVDNRGESGTGLADTNRPSSSAVSYDPNLPHDQQNDDWEPRQAVSLATSNASAPIDMVTMTIGGNDVGFAGTIAQCILGACQSLQLADSQGELPILRETRRRIESIIREIKSTAPNAVVFIIGYPDLVLDPPEDCAALSAAGIIDTPSDQNVIETLLSYVTQETLDFIFNVNDEEQEALLLAGKTLNRSIRNAAVNAGAHFVSLSPAFRGHAICSPVPFIWGLQPDDGDRFYSRKSFHPNEAGHRTIAEALARYIDLANRAGGSNDAGLPPNPVPIAELGGNPRFGEFSLSDSVDLLSDSHDADDAADRDEGEDPESESPRWTLLGVEPVRAAGNECGGWRSPGNMVTLIGRGLRSGSTVSFEAFGASLDGTRLVDVEFPAPVTADDEGNVAVGWTLPSAPDAGTDPIPRGYILVASGIGADGKAVRMITPGPLVAYPGAGPCAGADAAIATAGVPVRIPILSNDTPPSGGSFDAKTVEIESKIGGDYAINSDGSVTFTPSPGFSGTVSTRYLVFDNWGVGVRGNLTIEVSRGCTITGSVGVTVIQGTDGDDVICVPDAEDRRAFHIVYGKGGNDVILGGDGLDWIDAGAGNDIVHARDGNDRIDAGPGVDTIFSGDGFDVLYAVDLVDVVVDDDGYDLILVPQESGESSAPVVADDVVYAQPGEVTLVDVLGNDFDPDGDLRGSSLSIVQAPSKGTTSLVDSGSGTGHLEFTAGSGDVSTSFVYEVCDQSGRCERGVVTVLAAEVECTIAGTDGPDELVGTPGDDVICGFGGDDVIDGGDGDDVIVGGEGVDRLQGGAGDDVLYGGPGNDMLFGHLGDDVLMGGLGDDAMRGGEGDDDLWGGEGDDEAHGNAGEDEVYGGWGDDEVYGGNDVDTVRGGWGDDVVRGGAGDDVIWGDAGDDVLRGLDGADRLYGGTGDDHLHGGPGEDLLDGWEGDDRLRGDQDADILRGGNGDDDLNGNTGSDYLDGGHGHDVCTRGATIARCEA